MKDDAETTVQATLLVVHTSDADGRAILDEAARQVALGNASTHLRIVIGDETPEDAALWTADVVDGSDAPRSVPLFKYLGALGTISMFRFVAVCTVSADRAVAEELDARMRALREKTAFFIGGERPRIQSRIGIIGYGDQQVDPRFFSPLADANLVVIPLDRLEDASFARPVERSERDVFAAHGAVELISATGLWRTMRGAPIDAIRSGAGGGETRVRFTQARMRLLRTPALPVASILSEGRDLPIPEGFQPGPNIAARIGRAGDLLPAELRYEPSEPPVAARVDVDAKSLGLMLAREVGAALVDLPRLIWRAAGGEVAALTRRALQEAVGRDSRLRVLNKEDERSAGGPETEGGSLRRERERRIRAILEDDDIAVRLDPIPGEIWTSLVSETLGLVDGDPECAGLRQDLFGDELYVPVEREHLLGGLERLPAGVSRLAGGTGVGEGETGEAEPAPSLPREAAADAGSSTAAKDGDTPPPPPPQGRPVGQDGPLVTQAQQDAHRLELIRGGWRAIAARAGSEKKGADVVLQDAFPYDLSCGVLTIRFPKQRARYTARRAGDPELVAALLNAIRTELGGAPVAVTTLIEGDEDAWVRSFSIGELGVLLGLDARRLELDLKKYGIKEATGEALVTGDQLKGVIDAGPSKGPKLHASLSGYDEVLAAALFGRGALPMDRIVGLLTGASVSEGGGGEVLVAESAVSAPNVEAVVERTGDGLLVRVASAIAHQRAAATQDIQRLLGILREDRVEPGQQSLARSVPIGAGVGVILLLFRLGISDSTIRLIQGREWTAYQLDLWFTVSTLIILALALFLTDIGKRLGGQTRAMVFGAGTLGALAYTVLFFESLRALVSGPLRENRTFAVMLGVLTVSFVAYAAYQSWNSRSPLRIQGSRVLGLLVLVYAVAGLILLQAQPGSWVDTQSAEFLRRFNLVLLVVGVSLITIALTVITIVRVRDSRRLDNTDEYLEWAFRALEDAVEMRELLALGERQWLLTLAALSRLIRQPFGPVSSPPDAETAGDAQVLKAASVQLALNARGEAELEARVRQELVAPSWLRLQYERLIRAHQEMLATRAGVPVASVEDRRAECDVAVPTEAELRTGDGRGDRFEFARLLADGAFDPVCRQPIADIDVARVFQPMLADRQVQSLGGFGEHARTVREFFEQVVPGSEPKIPDGVIRTALAASEQARRMRAFVWWPESMMGELVLPPDVEVDRFTSELFRRGAVGGAGLVSVRVDISGEFAYSELVGAVESTVADRGSVAEDAADYDGMTGL